MSFWYSWSGIEVCGETSAEELKSGGDGYEPELVEGVRVAYSKPSADTAEPVNTEQVTISL